MKRLRLASSGEVDQLTQVLSDYLNLLGIGC